MDLIKTNKQKKRSVYKGDGYYRKLWHFVDTIWLDEHVKMLKNIVPDYVVYHGHNDEHHHRQGQQPERGADRQKDKEFFNVHGRFLHCA